MRYILISLLALLNLIYGILTWTTLSKETPGWGLVISISWILIILGLAGLFLWLKFMLSRGEVGDKERLNSWFELARSFDIVLVLGLIFRLFVFQPFAVEGNSMEPNFHDRQGLLVNKLIYHFRVPERGEVIIFDSPPMPGEDYIKRVVGLPGETITIGNNQVLINGQILDEDYLAPGEQTLIGSDPSAFLEKTLGPNEYFVMGDNRDNSSDSRSWGVLKKEKIIGQPFMTIIPLKDFGWLSYPETQLKTAYF